LVKITEFRIAINISTNSSKNQWLALKKILPKSKLAIIRKVKRHPDWLKKTKDLIFKTPPLI
jgi:hypothetical protein